MNLHEILAKCSDIYRSDLIHNCLPRQIERLHCR